MLHTQRVAQGVRSCKDMRGCTLYVCSTATLVVMCTHMHDVDLQFEDLD
jgi:hypothetical protein